MDLHALADFNLVAFHGGFSKAATASGRSKATLSRKVTELEQSLGIRLIERHSRAFRLTEEGLALHARTNGLLSEIAEAGEMVASSASIPRGRLRVSASVVLSYLVLGEIAGRFAQAYPNVQLEIVAEDRNVDLVEENYDVVLRIDPSPDDRLVGRCILRDERLVVGPISIPRPAPRQEGGEPIPVKATVLTSLPSNAVWRLTLGGTEDLVLKPEPILRLSSIFMVRDAVLAGQSVAVLPRSLVVKDIEEGRLACWGVLADTPVELWALQNSRRFVGAKVRAFLDLVEGAFPGRTYTAPPTK
jgi:DNA-binding transcriptional LysR family regulator